VIEAISVLADATTADGSGGNPRSGPNAWPSVTAYVRNAFSVAALGDDFGTIAYV
jgi:hypothetical protein